MKFEATRELFSYWNELRGERSAPERSEIDPAAIRGVLADAFMLDVDLGQTFPFRLAGTRVNGLFDAEQKGRSFLRIWRDEDQRNLAAVLLTVADAPVPVVVGGSAAPRGHEACGFEFLFLPLRHFGKTHARILGLVTAGSRPSWLGLVPLQPLALNSLRIIDETAPGARRVGRLAVGGARPAEMCVAAAGEEVAIENGVVRRGRPRLRLIQGGRSGR